MEEKIKILSDEEMFEALRRIIIFPGNQEEFERAFNCKTEFVDFAMPNKGLIYNADGYDNLFHKPHKFRPFDRYKIEFQRKIVEERVIALINLVHIKHISYSFETSSINEYYGLPIRKKIEDNEPLYIKKA